MGVAVLKREILGVPLYFWILFLLSIPLFKFYAQIDLIVSSWFYADGRFGFKDTAIEQFFHKSVRIFIIATALITLGLFAYNQKRGLRLFGVGKNSLLYIALVLALAPGLIVNGILKESCERPRPVQIKEFGKQLDFYPAYTCTNQGKDSFTSGHVAAATSLIGIALLARKRRNLWLWITSLYTAGMIYARIAAGGHFLSDTLSSFFIVHICNLILYHFIIEKKDENPHNPA